MEIKMYNVYLITFKTSQKQYVGFTSMGVMNRVHKHYLNSVSGIDNHFYRAMRMYGIKDILVETIYETDNKEEALGKEIYFIDKFDTFKNGYNSSRGGIGGFSVPEDKIELWKSKLSKKVKGANNPNFSGITNQQIIDKAVEFYLNNNNKLIRSHWRLWSKNNGYPQNYTKYRFGGTHTEFIKELKAELDNRNIVYTEYSFKQTKEERYTPEVNKKISDTLKGNIKNAKDSQG